MISFVLKWQWSLHNLDDNKKGTTPSVRRYQWELMSIVREVGKKNPQIQREFFRDAHQEYRFPRVITI
ncbi:MAG: hypothetical protein H9535_07535 [Ignavibacteria bacterium]|nr:hypothetical protein [Ignavibacteria bacterium]